MNYQKSLLLYEDQPGYGLLLRIVILVVPVILLATGYYLFRTGESLGGLVLAGEACLISLIFWAVFPRKYQVYEDYLRIALGGPMGIKIGFDKIKTIEVTNRSALTVNYVTRVARTYVLITRKRGLGFAITPKDNGVFAENAFRAFEDWKRRNRDSR